MFYQKSLGGKKGEGEKKGQHNTEEWKDMRRGLIIHGAVTLTTLTCGRVRRFQKPVVPILCLVLAIYSAWFIRLSQRTGRVHMKNQALGAYGGRAARGHVHVYNLPKGGGGNNSRHLPFARWLFFSIVKKVNNEHGWENKRAGV